ncbi:MAG: ferredoxin--NADP reductase [Dechloromonas sp.]|jgi:ferredoxin--NADP+ reductase|nr:ferredoxin--NADP reductase [Dechloromonas sp.]
MAPYGIEEVIGVHHWNDGLFSFRTTRSPGLRFENGQFLMLGLDVGGRPVTRAYSVASPNYADYLEFFSIKVADGTFTTHLQNVQPGDPILVGRRPTGTLVLRDLLPGRRLFLFATGTGLAPFLSVIRDPELYERFETVVLVHGARTVAELAYRHFLNESLPQQEFIGEAVREKLIYYPTVTRESFPNQGRITDLLESGKLFADIGQPALDPVEDRAMLCGSPAMLADCRALLDGRGFRMSRHIGDAGDYVIERAFVEK